MITYKIKSNISFDGLDLPQGSTTFQTEKVLTTYDEELKAKILEAMKSDGLLPDFITIENIWLSDAFKVNFTSSISYWQNGVIAFYEVVE